MTTRYGAESLQHRIISRHFKKNSDDPNDYYYQCHITGDCVKQLNGKKKFNLVAHAKLHKEFFRKNYETEAAALMSMPVRRLEFIQHCTELVTINSEPFDLLNKTGFLKMNKEKLQRLKDAGLNSGLSAPGYIAIKDHIGYLATEIVNEFRSEVDGKFVSLMVDGATRHHRSILGIYAQFMVDSQIVIRLIGMVNLTSRHTGAFWRALY